jgi:hypothetical protein
MKNVVNEKKSMASTRPVPLINVNCNDCKEYGLNYLLWSEINV